MDQNTLRRLQMTELEILEKVDDVCKKINIKYYFVGGTLLGAVRHKGFIPWDDDLDIAMPREDYNKFIELCMNGVLGDDYYLHHQKTDSGYWIPFAKVRKNNTLFDEVLCKNIDCNKGIFIDVFPLDYIDTNSGWIYHARAKIIKKLTLLMYFRGLKLPIGGMGNKILLQCSKCLSLVKLAYIRDNLASSCKHGKYYINYGSNYKYVKQTMPIEFYVPAVKIEFEGKYFNAPSKYFDYLKQLFKNWEELPSEEERRNHNPTRIAFDVAKEGK